MDSMLDRRIFLKLGAAGAVALATPTASATAQEKPKRGGTLTIGRNHDADTLYPGRSTGLSAIATNLLLYDGLVLHDFQMKIRPALAERWETSADGLTWTFHLRQERQVPLRRAAHRPGREGPLRPLDRSRRKRCPTRAKVTSLAGDAGRGRPHRRLQAQEPDARLPQQHQPDRVGLRLHPPRQARGPVRQGLRRGAGERLRHRAVPAQGVVEGRPDGARAQRRLRVGLARLRQHRGRPGWTGSSSAPLPEDASRAAELETGGIDLDIDVAPQHIARLEGRGVKVTSIPRLSSNHIGFNVEKDVFKDARVRKAVAHAVNREQIVQFVMKGQADVSHGFLHPLVPGASPEGADAAASWPTSAWTSPGSS